MRHDNTYEYSAKMLSSSFFLFLSLKNERTNRYSIYTKIMKRWKRPSSLYVQRVSISRNLTSTWPSGVDCFFHVLVDHISQNAFRTTASDLHTVYYTFCDTACSQFKLSLSLSLKKRVGAGGLKLKHFNALVFCQCVVTHPRSWCCGFNVL